MASQLAIEITLEQAQACIYAVSGPDPGLISNLTGAPPTYGVGNVNLIPEILQFDSQYDNLFLQGLKNDGVPIKFSSWHTNIFSTSSGSNVSLNIQERSRSVKAMFAVQRRPTTSFAYDSGATFFDTSLTGASSLQQFQFRLGGRYYPASPVQCAPIGSAINNGGAEAYVELSKALNILGDYRLSTNCNVLRWAIQPGNVRRYNNTLVTAATGAGYLNEYDYSHALSHIDPATGIPTFVALESAEDTILTSSLFCGDVGSGCFAMATNLETSNGIEISGLNGEEQSDFQLIAQWSGAQVLGNTVAPANIEVYSYYDAMMVLRENNVIELIS